MNIYFIQYRFSLLMFISFYIIERFQWMIAVLRMIVVQKLIIESLEVGKRSNRNTVRHRQQQRAEMTDCVWSVATGRSDVTLTRYLANLAKHSSEEMLSRTRSELIWLSFRLYCSLMATTSRLSIRPPGFKSDLGPLFYEARSWHRAYPSLHSSGVVHRYQSGWTSRLWLGVHWLK